MAFVKQCIRAIPRDIQSISMSTERYKYKRNRSNTDETDIRNQLLVQQVGYAYIRYIC
jgi:hypothetical protein